MGVGEPGINGTERAKADQGPQTQSPQCGVIGRVMHVPCDVSVTAGTGKLVLTPTLLTPT